ncbi:MAG: TraB/GumN family protein [Ruminococcaceae bacterium]|nr:TraB/GumN family protein [Oscillospiraceae bacterium]
MKRLFAVILICAVMLFSGCGRAENEITPPFFKVTDKETGGVVYMLGTMHVGTEDAVYPDKVYKALDESDVLAVELDVQELEANTAELTSAMQVMMLKGCTAEEYIGEDYKEIRKWFVEKGLYNMVYDYYIPAVWSSMAATMLAEDAGYKSELGTDRTMLTYAKEHNKEIYEIESAAEQYQVNANEGKELQIYALLETVRTDYDEQIQQMKDLYTAWANGDISALEDMLAVDEPPEELAEQYKQYIFEMYENRQQKMAEYVTDTLKNGGKAFVAVGAMHYAATPDIIDFVEQAGYNVEKIR